MALTLLAHTVAKGKRICAPPPAYFLSRTKQLCFRRNHLKDNQFHCKHLGLQQFSMTLAAMTSVNVSCCCSVPPSVFYNSVAETLLLIACCVQYCISVVTAIMDILCSPEQYAWESRETILCVFCKCKLLRLLCFDLHKNT